MTAEQAALVAAGINPAEVNDSVSEAKKGNHYGWEIAVTVRNALLNNLLSGCFDPEPLSISYWEHAGYDSFERVFNGMLDIIPAIQIHGIPDKARFEAISLWSWIAKNAELSPELHELISFRAPINSSKNEDNSTHGYLDPSHPRYAPKLAAVVQAWLGYSPTPGKTPKQTMTNWLTEHAHKFGLVNSEGNPLSGMDDLASLANWETKGGAPKTPSPT